VAVICGRALRPHLDPAIACQERRGEHRIPLTYVLTARNTLSSPRPEPAKPERPRCRSRHMPIDYSVTPDCRPTTCRLFSHLADLATKRQRGQVHQALGTPGGVGQGTDPFFASAPAAGIR